MRSTTVNNGFAIRIKEIWPFKGLGTVGGFGCCWSFFR